MNPIDIINKYYPIDSQLYTILLKHSTDVTNKAIEIAKKHPELNIDTNFVSEAGMLHDIGIFRTDAPSIQCFGTEPYIVHGIEGSRILQEEGFPKHALVCERHTGAGITLEEIIEKKFPLPQREMMPLSIEEQVICFADCFYSKTHLDEEKTVDDIRAKLAKFGDRSVNQFDKWCDLFL